MRHHDRFAGVLAILNEAARDDTLWPMVSGRLDEACGTRGNGLVMGRGHSQVDAEIFFARFRWHGERHENWEQSYFDDYFPLDERVSRLVQLPDSRLASTAELCTEQERRTSVTYNERKPSTWKNFSSTASPKTSIYEKRGGRGFFDDMLLRPEQL